LSTSDSTIPLTAICTKCGRSLSFTAEVFALDKRRPNGLSSWCRECKHENDRAYRVAHAEELKTYLRCYQAEHADYLSARHKAYYQSHKAEIALATAKWRDANKDKVTAYKRAWTEKHAEQEKRSKRAWKMANPEAVAAQDRNRKARKRSAEGTHTAADVRSQYARQKGRCFYCGQRLTEKYHVDHVVPLAKGGGNGPENLVIACPTCNLNKAAKHPMDFCGTLF